VASYRARAKQLRRFAAWATVERLPPVRCGQRATFFEAKWDEVLQKYGLRDATMRIAAYQRQYFNALADVFDVPQPDAVMDVSASDREKHSDLAVRDSTVGPDATGP